MIGLLPVGAGNAPGYGKTALLPGIETLITVIGARDQRWYGSLGGRD
jgi:hypothetical protein